MTEFSKTEKKILLHHARDVIRSALGETAADASCAGEVPSLLNRSRGCFVTLTVKGRLRGCIGTIAPARALFDAVGENARLAAFSDPRFSPVTAEELACVRIEISVLSIPYPLRFSGPEDLTQQLVPDVHGVIISKSGHSAVFLPQVWSQLPRKESFLENLCLKAGLNRQAWKDPDMRVEVFEAECFTEQEPPQVS